LRLNLGPRAELGVSWHTVSTIVMHTTADLVAAGGADWLSEVRPIGVDGPSGLATAIAPRRTYTRL
jgi:hypothetical protein